MQNRVWIELEPPLGDNGLDHELGKQRAALASALLRRLGADYGSHEPVWWHDRRGHYCWTLDTAGGYVESLDHGKWFNLDYMGRGE